MKNLIYSFRFGLILLAIVGLNSCEERAVEDNGTGTAEFSITVQDEENLTKSAVSDDTAVVSFQILISVEDMAGMPVFTDKLIPLYSFGTNFVSENLEIKKGEYRLTKFMVINPSGEVVFATPVAGSPLAYLVNQPLPLTFSILPEQVTRVMPEVLAVGDQTPGDFGYVNFGLQIIKPLTFWTAAVIDNPMIMAPFPQYTEAKLTVYARDGWHYTFKLSAGLNQLTIRGGSDIYQFLVEKDGYLPLKLQFKGAELMAATRDNPLYLMIPWDSWTYKTLVLQPGPDAGKDAMVSNLDPDKNFGDHKYFEATFLTEPILTVMRSNRSLISFDLGDLPKSAIIKKVVLQLSYDIPVSFDSSYVTETYPSTGIIWYGGVLQQIIAPWEEGKVTWNTQPATTEMNQVYIPPFIRNTNFIAVDVTRLFVNSATTDQAVYPNFGMLFRLWPNDRFPGFRFASSDYSEASMRPKLTIHYTI